MRDKINFNNVLILLLGLVAFFIPLLPKILPLLIIVAAIVWLSEIVYAKSWRLFKPDRNFYLLSGLYLLYVLGVLYTENLQYALRDLETKLSLLVFPLIFASSSITIQSRRRVLLFFLAGCFTAMSYNLFNAAYQFYLENTTTGILNYNRFLYFHLSPTIHPSYLATYLCFAVAIIISWIRNETINISRKFLFFALLFLVIFIFMLSSKAGVITLLTILLLYLILFLKNVVKVSRILIPTAFIVGCIFMYLFLVPGATSRLEINPELFNRDNVVDSDTDDSSELRILTWKSAIGIIKNNFLLGVGTGDVKDELISTYNKNNIKWAEYFQLNAHNQYLQTWVAIGLFGFLFLLVWIFLPVIYGVSQKDHPMFLLGIIIFINLLFESMLETQAGVIFIGFFVCLLVLNKKPQLKKLPYETL